ncbi:hypothetical protein DL769_003085 [Monosporascus sp. CRB-8-3]|nr:hypothetical protein DL769_003085 [Monosporascus sp. CRB-8-3]
MLRKGTKAKADRPVIVMLHGSGSSSAIFGIQTHFVARELSRTYDLAFLDAPTPCAPGPGVLPLFAGMPGYYRWLTTIDHPASNTMRVAELFNVARYIETQLDTQGINPAKVEAFFGFSQGALVAMAMLGLRQAGQSAWDNLRFCVAIGAGTTGNEAQLAGIEKMFAMLSGLVGRGDGKFLGYTAHAVGTKDLWYGDGKRLATMCAGDRTMSMDYGDGHVVPRQKADVSRLLMLIDSIDRKSKSGAFSTEDSSSAVLNSLPSVLDGGDIEQAMAMLAEYGITV